MTNYRIFTFNIISNNKFVAVNSLLDEFYIANELQLNFYGLTQITYYRFRNQTIFYDRNYLGEYNNQSLLQKTNVLFDKNFKFKNNDNLQSDANKFILTGGLLEINFQVEDKYQHQIRLNLSYFLRMEYKEVQYFWFSINDQFLEKDYIILYQNDTNFLTKFNDSQEYQFDINDLQFLQQIQSFDYGYLMQDIRDGVKYIMRINDQQTIDLIQFDCRENLNLLTCYIKYCICLDDNQIVIQSIEYSVELLQLFKNQEYRFVHIDFPNSILYLIKDNQLKIKYYNVLKYEFHNISILICVNFIHIVILKLKLIIICTDQMIVYNKISDYRYVYSGNIEMYDQQFTTSAQIINSYDYLFYIIEDQILHVFNSNLPLSQIYVTKMRINQYDTVKSFNNHICFQSKNNLLCYQFQINIKFNYDDDQVVYHQVFKVNVCGENKYDRICKQYITRLDQQINNKISIKNSRYQLTINKNTNEIQLDNRYFSGTINKIQINKHQIKPKLQLYAVATINITLSGTTHYGGYDNFIFIINNLSLSVCKELITLKINLTQYSFLQINDNTLYTILYSSLITYNLDTLIKNGSFEPIEEKLNANMIDISQDTNGNMCIVYIDLQYKLVYKQLEKIKIYNILKSFRDQ